MFKKSKIKQSVHLGSKESLSSSGENLSGSRDHIFESSNSLHRSTQLEVYFLGMIQDVNLGGTCNKDPDVQLIDKLEEAQLEGKIYLVPKEEHIVNLTVSTHGVKVLNPKLKEVLQRHPLHTVAEIVYYTDSFYKSNVALKIGQVGRSVYDCYVFQCYNEDQAQKICQSLKDVFDMITSISP